MLNNIFNLHIVKLKFKILNFKFHTSTRDFISLHSFAAFFSASAQMFGGAYILFSLHKFDNLCMYLMNYSYYFE